MDVAAFMSRYEAILKERKIKKMQFYKDCGFTDAAVSQWRKGKNIPSMKNIKTIADYLDVTVEYLLTGNSEQKENPTVSGEVEVTDEDMRHLAAFHNADEDTKRAIKLLLAKFERGEE